MCNLPTGNQDDRDTESPVEDAPDAHGAQDVDRVDDSTVEHDYDIFDYCISAIQPVEEDGGLEELLLKINAFTIGERELNSAQESSSKFSDPCVGVTQSGPQTELNFRGVQSHNTCNGGAVKGFTLESHHASMLLLNQSYFIVFPNIYVFDRHRIVCRVDNRDRYHEVDELKPNPPTLESLFYIEKMPFWFDGYGELWYSVSGQWYQETIHQDLGRARSELAGWAEKNRIEPPNSVQVASPSTSSTIESSSLQVDPSSDDEYVYPPLGTEHGQDQIDAWFEEFKNRRTALLKTRERLSDIKCPVDGCRKVQRRPQALRDHLYFHFGIKPYKCDYGCSIAFETEANKNRHLESCAFQRSRR